MLHKIGMPELLVILAIALVIFGGKALPKMGEAIKSSLVTSNAASEMTVMMTRRQRP